MAAALSTNMLEIENDLGRTVNCETNEGEDQLGITKSVCGAHEVEDGPASVPSSFAKH
jgi:hypothetical protein